MGDPNENLGVGGGQPPTSPLGGASLDAEEKAMRKGKGKMLAGMIAAVVIAVVLAIVFLASGGEAEAYRTFGRNVNGLKQQHFDQFWACALRGQNVANIGDNAALQHHINVRAQQGGKRYASQVKDDCMPKLAELRPNLDALIPPGDMTDQVNALAEASSQLRSAWSNFIAWMETQDRYDPDAAEEQITNIARGWYEFKTAHSAINARIRTEIGQ